MVYGCGNSCIKFLMITANLLICVFGAIVAGFALFFNLSSDAVNKLTKFLHDAGIEGDVGALQSYRASLWVLVAVGILIFLVGFLGCCGACCESSVLLGLFFVIVLILSVIDLGAVIFAVSNKASLKTELKKSFEKILVTDADKFKAVQEVFKCCKPVPNSDPEWLGHCTAFQDKDCYTAVNDWIQTNGVYVVVFAFLLLAIQLIALIFACVLCRAFRYDNSSRYYYA